MALFHRFRIPFSLSSSPFSSLSTPSPLPKSPRTKPPAKPSLLVSAKLPGVWTESSKRVGLVGVKCGMTRIWDAWGQAIPVTLVKLDQCFVTQQKTQVSPKGFMGLQTGAGLIHPKNCEKSKAFHLEKAGLPPLRKLVEFQVTKDAMLPPGKRLDVRHFYPGQQIDVIGTSKGHGFSGAMKRWNFRGQSATHGASVSHRSLGATGSRQDPGKVFKGKKMAGRWGAEQVTIHNVVVEKLDVWNEVLFLHGCIPGVVGSYVIMRDGIKNSDKFKAPFPTYFPRKADGRTQFLHKPASKNDPFMVPKHIVAQ